MPFPKDSRNVDRCIVLIHGQKVILDSDLAEIYGTTTKKLNQAVQRNADRFPADFMFRLTEAEAQTLGGRGIIRIPKHGGRRHIPFVFTEHGAVMLSAVLSTPLAIQASIEVARAFVRLRRFIGANRAIAEKLRELEGRIDGHDAGLRKILDTIQGLIGLESEPAGRIGFRPDS